MPEESPQYDFELNKPYEPCSREIPPAINYSSPSEIYRQSRTNYPSYRI